MNIPEIFQDSRILITGGLGFIGGNLAHALAGRCADLVVIDPLIPRHGGNIFNINGIEDQLTVEHADIRDARAMDRLVRGADFIFNMAGQVSHIDSMADPCSDLEINCRAHLILLETCRKRCPRAKILYAGTRGQYGRISALPVSEEHPQNPTDINGIDKAAGEKYHLLYNNVHGLRAVSLRLTNTYGPRHVMRTSRQGVLSWFIRLALDGEEIPLFGGGTQVRDFNHVDDVVEAMVLAMASDAADGNAYNLGGGEPTSLRRAAELVIEIAGSGSVREVPFPDEQKRIEIGDYRADYSRMSKATGWKPRVGLRDGLERTIDFYRRNRDHYWQASERRPE